MTGVDAWHLIAPVIAGNLIVTEEGAKAYVTLFCALKKWDELERMKEQKNDKH